MKATFTSRYLGGLGLLVLLVLGQAQAETPVRVAVERTDDGAYFLLESATPLAGTDGIELATVTAYCAESHQVFVARAAGDKGGAIVVGRVTGLLPKRVRVRLLWGVGSAAEAELNAAKTGEPSKGTSENPPPEKPKLDRPRQLELVGELASAESRNGLAETWREAAADHFDRLSRLPGPHAFAVQAIRGRLASLGGLLAPPNWLERINSAASAARLSDTFWLGFAGGRPGVLDWLTPFWDRAEYDLTPRPGQDTAKVYRAESLAPPRSIPLPSGGGDVLPPPGKLEPARFVPADSFILRFGSRRAAARFGHLLSPALSVLADWLGPEWSGTEIVELTAGSFVLDLTALGIGTLGDPTLLGSELLPAGAVGPCSDLTLLVGIQDRAEFLAARDAAGGEALPGTSSLGQVGSILRHVSPDGRRTLYSVLLGREDVPEFWALGPSPGLLRRMARLMARPEESLAAEPSYRAQPIPALDDGLLFLPPSYLHKIFGPRRVIDELRRAACMRQLRQLRDAQAAFHFRYGRFADTLEELLSRSGLPTPNCPGGGRYRLAGDRTPVNSIYGRLDRPTFVDELPDDLLTEREAATYRRVSEQLRALHDGPESYTNGVAVRLSTRGRFRLDVQFPDGPIRRATAEWLSQFAGLLEDTSAPAAGRGIIRAGSRDGDRLPHAVAAARMRLALPGLDEKPVEFVATLEWLDFPAGRSLRPDTMAGWLSGNRWLLRVGPLSGAELAAVRAALPPGNRLIVGPAGGPHVPTLVAHLNRKLSPAAGNRPLLFGTSADGDLLLSAEAETLRAAAARPAVRRNEVRRPDPQLPVHKAPKKAVRKPAEAEAFKEVDKDDNKDDEPEPADPEELDGQVHLLLAPRLNQPGPGWLQEGLDRLSASVCAGRLAAEDVLARSASFRSEYVTGWANRLGGPAGFDTRCPEGPQHSFTPMGGCRCPRHGGLHDLAVRSQGGGPDALSRFLLRVPEPWRQLELAVRVRPESVGFTLRWGGPELPTTRLVSPSAKSSPQAAARLEQADEYRAAGRDSALLDELQTLVWLHPRGPETAEAVRRLAQLRSELGRPELDGIAKRVARLGLDIEQVRGVLEGLIEEYDGSRLADEARLLAGRLATRTPEEYIWLAEAAAARSDYGQAIRLLESLRIRFPDHPTAGPPAERYLQRWWKLRAEGEWRALMERIDREALAPAEARPLLSDFRRRYPASAAGARAARMDEELSRAGPGTLIVRAREAAVVELFGRAILLAEKVPRFYPDSPEVAEASRLIEGWTMEQVNRRLERLRQDRSLGRIDFDEHLLRIGELSEQYRLPAAGERLAQERRDIVAHEADDQLAVARAAARSGRPAVAVDLAEKLILRFPDTPAAQAARQERPEWFRAWSAGEIDLAQKALAAGHPIETINRLDRLTTRAGFPEALELISNTRRQLLGSEPAVERFRRVLELTATANDEQFSEALTDLIKSYPDEPLTRQADALRTELRQRRSAVLLRSAERAFGNGQFATAGQTLAELESKYADTPAREGAERLTARILAAETARIAELLAAEKTRAAQQRLAELRKNPAFPLARRGPLESAVSDLVKIHLLHSNPAEATTLRVAEELSRFLAGRPAGDPFANVAKTWAQRWRLMLRR